MYDKKIIVLDFEKARKPDRLRELINIQKWYCFTTAAF